MGAVGGGQALQGLELKRREKKDPNSQGGRKNKEARRQETYWPALITLSPEAPNLGLVGMSNLVQPEYVLYACVYYG